MTQTPNLLITEIAANQNQKEVTANNAFIELEAAMTNLLAVTMTDADLILTATEGGQALGNIAFVFSGTLTANRNIIVPANKKAYFVINNTTGGHNLVVKTSGGTGVTVAVATTPYTICYCDGTNVVEVGSASGGGSSTLAALTDVDLSTLIDGQVLQYNASIGRWENHTPESNGAFSGSIGDGSSTTITVTHNLGTTSVAVSVFDIASGAEEPATTTYTVIDANNVSITFAVPPSSDSKQVVILAAGGSGGADSLSSLSDVNITSPQDSDLLQYNASTGKWENKVASGGGGSNLIFEADGDSLSGWSVVGTVTANNTSSGFSPNDFQSVFVVGAGGASYAFINLGASLAGATIELDIAADDSGAIVDFLFGCTALGAGPMLRLDGRGGTDKSGLAIAAAWNDPITALQFSYVAAGKTFYHVKFVISANGANVTWSINGAVQGQGPAPLQGTYIGFFGDAGDAGGHIANIRVYKS